MEKKTLLHELHASIQRGEILKEEVETLFSSEPLSQMNQEHTKQFSINVVNILYGIGGLIVFSGVIALIVQNWDVLTSPVRILITLGMALVLYISGVLVRYQHLNVLSEVFSAVAYMLFPLGIGVTLYELSVEPTLMQISIIGTILTLFATTSYFLLKRGIVHLLFSVIFGTITAYFYLATLYENTYYGPDEAYIYLTMALGLSYILIAYVLKQETRDNMHVRLGALLYSLGTFGILVGSLSLGGIWDVLFVGVVMITFLASVYLSSRGMLILSSLFLVFYLFKITSEYFAGSVGWPVALIFIGITTIIVAIGTFKVNQKYFSHAQQLRSQKDREEMAGGVAPRRDI